MPKILIVEDNQENRDALSRRLERRGYSVIIATDGRAGVTMAQEEQPDLILLATYRQNFVGEREFTLATPAHSTFRQVAFSA